MPVRIDVDWDLCESNGLCMAAAPEVFQLGDDDNLTVLDDQPGPELRAKVDSAARSCPRGAITVLD